MKLTCDVLIVGAGVAGGPAAVAAARAGAETILVERHASPGGLGVIGLHRTICGLYENGVRSAEPAPLLNGGLVQEMIARLHELAPNRRPFRLGKVDVLPYAVDQFQSVYSQMLNGEARLRVLFNREVTGVSFGDGRVVSVRAGEKEIVPRVVIDCSGSGVLISKDPALHEVPPASGCQLAGYVIQLMDMSGVDDMLPIQVPYTIRQGVEAGVLPPFLRFTTFVAGEGRNEGWCKLSVPSGTSVAVAQNWVQHLHEYLRQNLPAMRASRVNSHSAEVLEREGLRLKGQYILTADDILVGREFPDSIARTAWPMELWDPKLGPTYRYPEGGAACGIPLRCLRAGAVANLYCAGRCISVTHEALAATRVMGTCMAVGEAAGRDAARLAGSMK